MSKTLEDICDMAFFEALGDQLRAPAGMFIITNEQFLVLHMLVNYGKLKALDTFDNKSNTFIGTYVGKRFAISLEKIYATLTANYDPLANTSVVETEEKDGEDKNTRGGTDTSTVLSSISTHSATTFDNPTTENETGKTSSTGSSKVDYGRTDTMEYDTVVTKRKDGNIGVMPTQQLLELEVDMRIRRTFFEAIATCVCIALSSGVWEDDD